MKTAHKKLLQYLILIAVFGLTVFGIYYFFSQPTGPLPGEFFKAQNRDHIEVGAQHDSYNSNPPTGGWHYLQPAVSGIYDKELPDEQLVHNLEHGHIWIAYKPGLAKDQIESLIKIAKSYKSKIIVTPRTANDTPIAIVSWEYLLKLDNFDETQIKAFIKAHRGKGPELVPDFGFKDFRENK